MKTITETDRGAIIKWTPSEKWNGNEDTLRLIIKQNNLIL